MYYPRGINRGDVLLFTPDFIASDPTLRSTFPFPRDFNVVRIRSRTPHAFDIEILDHHRECAVADALAVIFAQCLNVTYHYNLPPNDERGRPIPY